MKKTAALLLVCLLASSCSGNLTRRDAKKLIAEIVSGEGDATIQVSTGKIEHAGVSEIWAMKHGLAVISTEKGRTQVVLTKLGATIALDVPGITDGTRLLRVGKVDVQSIDIMRIFTDGPRAKVDFSYCVKFVDPSYGDLVEDKSLDGQLWIGALRPGYFSKAGEGSYQNFGVANFEKTDNGWETRYGSVLLDSSGS